MIVVIGILLILLVVLGMAAAMMMGKQKDIKQKNIAVIKGQSKPLGTIEEEIKNAQDRRRADIAKKLKDASEEEEGIKKTGLRASIEQAGWSITPKQFWINSCIFGFLFTMTLKFVFGLGALVVLMGAVTGFFGIPRFVLNRAISKRQALFLKDMPDMLEAMVRMLKAGMPIGEAISMAGKEFEGPIGEEMLRIYDQQKIGVPMAEACMEAARRMPLTEMQMFATGIAIQSQTGASLSDVLTNLSGVIRSRFQLKRKVKALSSEAKSSAAIIGALPFLIGGGIYLIRPDYISVLFTTTVGKGLLMGAAVWMSIGIMIMKVMINFKI